MRIVFLYIEKLPVTLQEFLDSDMIIVLFILAVLLIILIGIVGAKFYYQTKEVDQLLARKVVERAKPLPKMEEEEAEDTGEGKGEEKEEATPTGTD